jgi:hypothetical protein
MNLRMYTLRETTSWQSSGLIRFGCKAITDLLVQNLGAFSDCSATTNRNYLRHGMTISAVEMLVPLAERVSVTEDTLSVDLSDGRTIAVPLAWFPRLLHATQRERSHWRLIGKGQGIHWPELDEDISVEGLLVGKASGESQTSFKKWLEGRASRLPTRSARPRPRHESGRTRKATAGPRRVSDGER